jgi:hypothetical protein
MTTAKTAPTRAKATAQPVKKTSTKTLSKAANGATAKPAAPAHVDAAKPKHKLVRDSFTIPKAEYLVLDVLKLRVAKLGHPAKKSELIRAGIAALNAMTDKLLLATLETVPSIKTGRPKAAVGPKAGPTS